MPVRSNRLLSAAVFALCALAACKRDAPAPAPASKPTVVQTPPAPVRTRDQAMAALMALPELKAWSDDIERRSHGKAHGAVIEDDPNPRVIEGKAYYQLSFVEDRTQNVHRRASFLVSKGDDEILVEDGETNAVQSLAEWRRNIRNVEIKSK